MLSGCATTQYRPVVDTYGGSAGSYEADLAQCQQLAEQRPAANQAAAGAATGAIFGALLAAAVGLRGDQIAHVAAWGAASGGVQGAARGVEEQAVIVARCMDWRGYAVVAP
jgi:hypothetical protein